MAPVARSLALRWRLCPKAVITADDSTTTQDVLPLE